MNLFRRKSIATLQADAASDTGLKRALGPVNLTLLGIGAIIGTGIFVLTGTVVAESAYSRIRSQPMIQAMNSPRVAYP